MQGAVHCWTNAVNTVLPSGHAPRECLDRYPSRRFAGGVVVQDLQIAV